MWQLKVLTFGITVFYLVFPGYGQDFSYDGNEGPNYWGQKYQACVGKHQSPIDIEEHDVEIVQLSPMEFENFARKPKWMKLENNGHTVVLMLDTDGEKPRISGGPLIGKYDFQQLHFHWGSNDTEGSETRINNNSFPMELHMVFFRSAYGSYQEATEHPDGLVVLSFLYSSSNEVNVNYTPLLDALAHVQQPKSTTFLKTTIPLDNLINDERGVYFTYGGSLTTPPCSEVVTWIEFKDTIPLAHEQIDMFRHLSSERGLLSHNFRPVQPLHGRTIRMNQISSLDREVLKENSIQNLKQKENSSFQIKYSILLTIFTLLMLTLN